MLKSIKDFAITGITRTVKYSSQILLVVLFLFFITLMVTMLHPIRIKNIYNNTVQLLETDNITNDEESDDNELENGYKIQKVSNNDSDKNNTIQQDGYDLSGFNDSYEYGVYPKSYNSYSIDEMHNNCTDNVYPMQTTDNTNIIGSNAISGYMLYPTDQYNDSATLDRSTHTWSYEKPNSDFRDTYEWASFPGWYTN